MLKSKNKKGFASILLIGIVGISIGGLILSTSYAIKSNQKQSITTNILTQAQLKVWTTQEAIKKYFEILNESELSNITKGNLQIDNSVLPGVTVTIQEITPNDTVFCDGSTRIGLDILAKVNSSNSSAYSILCVGSAGTATNNTTTVVKKMDYILNLKGNTTFTGAVQMLGINKKDIQIDGNVELNQAANLAGANIFTTGTYKQPQDGKVGNVFAEKSITIDGVNSFGRYGYLKSLGNISLSGSGNGADLVQANGFVSINSSSFYPLIKSNGNLTLSGGGTVTNAFANGAVSITNSTVTNVVAKGSVSKSAGQNITNISTDSFVSITNGGTGSIKGDIKAGGDVSLRQWNMNPKNIISGGNVSFGAYSQTVNSVYAKGNFSINSSTYNSKVTTGIVGGTVAKGGTPSQVNVVRQAGYNPTPPLVNTDIQLLEKMTVDSNKINAEDYIGQANYIFDYINGDIVVTPQNLTDTTLQMGKQYYMLSGQTQSGHLCKNGSISSSWSNYCNLGWVQGTYYNSVLCPTKKYSKSQCVIITKQPGDTWQQQMITYNGGTFNLEENANNGPMFGGGILFFRGNVNITNATVYNTIIATGDINADSNTIETKASNNNNYSFTCNNNFPKPINLCNNGAMLSPVVGNSAFIAGSYTKNEPIQFIGGNISIASSAKIGGAVIAGNTIFAAGGATINGYVLAARQSGDLNSLNYLGEGLIIDLTTTELSYKPEEILTTTTTNTQTTTNTYVSSAKIKFNKYK